MKDELLTKEDIARELSDSDDLLSIRSVERYINLANIKPAVKGSGRGKQAKFRRADVEKIKAAKLAAAEQREQQSTALTTTKPANVQLVAVVAQLAEAAKTIGQTQKSQPRADVGSKIMLTLADAAELSSLSKDYLREAIKAGSLKGRIIGRGYKIKRAALDAYIKKL
jgi:excisionase family DNA binding protein